MATGIQLEDTAGGTTSLKGTNGAAAVADAATKNPGSASNPYSISIPNCNLTILAPGLAQTVTSAPALLLGIAGANGVVNGSVVTLKDGGTTVETYPASTIPIAGKDYRGAKFNTSLIVDIVVASGTSLAVYWLPQ